MDQRRLTRDGRTVSVIGLGTWPMGGGMGVMDDDTAAAITRSAIDRGINLIDTAQAYLESERRLGRALKDGYREKCFLATKVIGDYSPNAINAAMDNSLRQLDVDHVDLYQIHHPDPTYPFDEMMQAVVRLQEQGKARYIGVSNFKVDHMETALRHGPIDTHQPRYSMFDRRVENDVLPFCLDHGIGVLVHSPLAKGLLTGRYRAGHVFADDDERATLPRFGGESFAHYVEVADRLKKIAAAIGISLIQLAVAWVLRRAEVSCVLVGAKSPGQLDEPIAAANVRLDSDTIGQIDEALRDTPGELYDVR